MTHTSYWYYCEQFCGENSGQVFQSIVREIATQHKTVRFESFEFIPENSRKAIENEMEAASIESVLKRLDFAPVETGNIFFF